VLWLAFAVLFGACSNRELPPSPAVQALIEKLDDARPSKRIDAAIELMRMGPSARAAVPALIANLGKKRDPGETSMMANALLRIGPGAALPALIGALSSDDPDVASGAAFVIGGFGRAARSAVPALLKALENPRTRASASASLKMIQDG
jgi:HEAT repeat protein